MESLDFIFIFHWFRLLIGFGTRARSIMTNGGKSAELTFNFFESLRAAGGGSHSAHITTRGRLPLPLKIFIWDNYISPFVPHRCRKLNDAEVITITTTRAKLLDASVGASFHYYVEMFLFYFFFLMNIYFFFWAPFQQDRLASPVAVVGSSFICGVRTFPTKAS